MRIFLFWGFFIFYPIQKADSTKIGAGYIVELIPD